MVNLRLKGQRNEKKCEDELINDGWECIRVHNSGNKFQKRVDFFGLWDVIALKQGHLRFIQVKTNNSPAKHKYLEWLEPHRCNPFIRAEIWIWYEAYKSSKYKGWRKIVLK